MGDSCYAVGGRTTKDVLLTGEHFVCIYDAAANQWMKPAKLRNSPTPRTSHTSVVVGSNQLVICGGVAKHKHRLNDSQVLSTRADGCLAWSQPALSPFTSGE